MQTEGSVPYTPPRPLYPATNESSPRPPKLLNLLSNIILHGDLIPSDFLSKILYAFLFSTILATCPAHLIVLGSN